MIAPLIAASAAALAASEPPPPAQEVLDTRYEECVARLGESVAEARKAAERWHADGGGAPALHCLAVADLAAGYPKLAAVRLLELADRPEAGDDLVRARILAQAARAWLEAGETDLAAEALDAAFAKAPGAGELYLTAAKIRLAREEYQAAADAVTKAEEAGFASTDAYVDRARARMALLQHRAAAEDVVAALKLDPMNVEALVLRGELQQLGVAIDANYRRPEEAGDGGAR
ncbi:MAG: hypothetical protein Kow00133_01160 [Amphiplicatus sp.]